MTIYAIPDVHGHPDQLARAHERIAADRAREGTADAPVVHLGDLADRGPDTRGVIDFLLRGLSGGEDWVVLLGNHDRILLDFLTKEQIRDFRGGHEAQWLSGSWGGRETLASYGIEARRRSMDELRVEARENVPETHVRFLAERPLHHEAGELLFVHAGIRPGVPLDRQREDDLVWIRDGFLEDTRQHPWLVVHGHTTLPEPTHFGNRVGLDAGAGYGNPLVAAVFEGRDVWLLDEDGRRPLKPLPWFL